MAQTNTADQGLDGAPITTEVPDEDLMGQHDKMLPALWVNSAINACIVAPDDAMFIKAVRRFANVIRPNVKKRFALLLGDAEAVAKLRELVEDLPQSYAENPGAWQNYAKADFHFEKLMEALYSSLGEERRGRI
jgi:hypothetical protein